MLIKTLGSIIIITCGLVFGMSEKAKLSGKTRILKDIINAVDFIHSEISCMCTPTEELLDKLCEMCTGEVERFFRESKDYHLKRRDLPFAIIWNKILKNAVYLALNKNEENTLSEIGNALGRYEADEQMRVLINARKNFVKYLCTAEDAQSRLGRLYGNLSLISGIAIVIILL